MSKITKQQLQSYLWESANILRGKIDSGDFKHYILGLLFYKRLSDVFDEEFEKLKERAWRKEAKEYLPKRVEELASKNKFDYKKVAVKNSKTRWGSCSFDNSINLSLHLMRLPDHLVDYVILHELVHTKIKNHSRDFWQLLDIVSGNAKKLDREVKDCRIQIY